LNPNGEKGGITTGASIFTKLTHQILLTTFQELTFAFKFNDYTSHLYDDPYDPRYVHPDALNTPGYHFHTAGTDLNRFQRNTKSIIGKWDLTSQINRYNLIKTGVEIQDDRVFYEYISLVPSKNASGQDIVPFVPLIQGIDSPTHDRFERRPFKAAAYLQNKIELENVIINLGLRFEIFDPRGKIPTDKEDPNIFNPFKLEHIYKDTNQDGKIGLDEQTGANEFTLQEREAFWYRNSTIKTQLSPRFGIAYPITDKGIIRFSYGIFQQIPEYSQLYLGDQFKLTSAQGIQGVTNDRNVQVPFGNNDLKPQRTTIYEIGLQQQFSEDYAIDVTAFYRDIRDWISSSPPIQTFQAGISYSERINRDFANVRGITFSFNKRYSHNFSLGIDYTYQVAEGTNSSPDEEFFSQLNGSEPKRILTPLSWDQTHTLNINIYVGDSDWGVSLVGNLNSGQPYTPTLIQGAITGKDVMSGLADNSLRKPFIVNLDLEVHRNIKISDVNLQLFVKIFNVLDTKNPTTVYGDTGKPDFTVEQQTVSGYDQGWFVNPSYYSEPRSVYVGTKISL
jgi:outer membrane receptor protein involved in Fe transport